MRKRTSKKAKKPATKVVHKNVEIPVKPARIEVPDKLHIEDCPRCGKAHTIQLHQLKRPSGPFTHWATCPKTNEPLFILHKLAQPTNASGEIFKSIENNAVRSVIQQEDQKVLDMMDAMRGAVPLTDKLTTLLYLLMRDKLPAGDVAMVVDDIRMGLGTEKHLVAYARELTEGIVGE
jgi:hypothetical protein